ncbi:HEPN domain-containing protein [Aquibacillus rhizosphaerae]|uniref:HEPN domain-containing protein n=1 Tax=Aquibacillus rhizosphaerae TaxID=3051431 RepID=A0ABT7L4M6_9BACI|nr:hypothetical protein [Aquibacillus sp. LR5S19]MDL4840334.1 hypothetical protein [Aquibacillus sp. LR5S19]
MYDLSDEEKNRISKFIVDGAPGEWLSFAEELMHSAEILWKQNDGTIRSEITHDKIEVLESREVSGISRSYFLLVGFAIENLLKGLIVFDDPTTITSGKIKRIKTHKITNLIKEISEINLSEEELEICKKIEEAIPYWGRYPIPLEAANISPDIGITPEMREVIRGMYSRLASILYHKVKDGWESGTGEYSRLYILKYE